MPKNVTTLPPKKQFGDLRDFAGLPPPYLCMDGHEPIGHWDSEHELCPVCRAKGAADTAEERLAREAAIVDSVWRALGIHTYADAKGKSIVQIVAKLKRLEALLRDRADADVHEGRQRMNAEMRVLTDWESGHE